MRTEKDLQQMYNNFQKKKAMDSSDVPSLPRPKARAAKYQRKGYCAVCKRKSVLLTSCGMRVCKTCGEMLSKFRRYPDLILAGFKAVMPEYFPDTKAMQAEIAKLKKEKASLLEIQNKAIGPKNDEEFCKDCGRFLPVYNDRCECCLSGSELEKYMDMAANEETKQEAC